MDLAGITDGTAQVQVSTLDLAWGKIEASSLVVGNCSGKRSSSLYFSKNCPGAPYISSLVLSLSDQFFPTSPNFLPPSFSPKLMKNKL